MALQEHAEIIKEKAMVKFCNVCKQRKSGSEFATSRNTFKTCHSCLDEKRAARKIELQRRPRYQGEEEDF